ncbi:MAG: hypothetical protein ABUT39_29105, partial [Acidobacteriota bacterium]
MDSPPKQRALAAAAAALHAEWSAALGTPRPGVDGAERVMDWVAHRADELARALADGSLPTEEHNDQRFA